MVYFNSLAIIVLESILLLFFYHHMNCLKFWYSYLYIILCLIKITNDIWQFFDSLWSSCGSIIATREALTVVPWEQFTDLSKLVILPRYHTTYVTNNKSCVINHGLYYLLHATCWHALLLFIDIESSDTLAVNGFRSSADTMNVSSKTYY